MYMSSILHLTGNKIGSHAEQSHITWQMCTQKIVVSLKRQVLIRAEILDLSLILKLLTCFTIFRERIDVSRSMSAPHTSSMHSALTLSLSANMCFRTRDAATRMFLSNQRTLSITITDGSSQTTYVQGEGRERERGKPLKVQLNHRLNIPFVTHHYKGHHSVLLLFNNRTNKNYMKMGPRSYTHVLTQENKIIGRILNTNHAFSPQIRYTYQLGLYPSVEGSASGIELDRLLGWRSWSFLASVSSHTPCV